MTYNTLKFYMMRFHLGEITRTEMIAAIALWQRPVDCATNKKSAIEAVIR